MRGQIVHIIYHTHLENGVHFNFLPTYKSVCKTGLLWRLAKAVRCSPRLL